MHVIPTRLLPREFIKLSTQDNYIEAYLNIKLADNPYRPYSSKTNIDQHIDIWNSSKEAVIEKLNNDAKTISASANFPFDSIDKLTAENSENTHKILAELQQMLLDSLPLIADEVISTTAIYYLNTEWEGLAAGTIIFYRKTNFSEIYFALPDMQIDLNKLQASLLFNSPGKPNSGYEKRPMNDLSELNLPTAMLAAASDSSDLTEMGFEIYDIASEVASTLAWAWPAKAPYVDAGISVISFLVNLFNPKTDYAELIQMTAKKITTEIKNYIQQQDITKKSNALLNFAGLITKLQTLLNTDSASAYKQAVTEDRGLLLRFNNHILGNDDNDLNALIVALMNDNDINPSSTKDAYASFSQWIIAKNKMQLLFYAISNYLLAIKIKIALVDKLYEYGYDENGNTTTEQNRSTYFQFLDQKVKKFQTEIPKYINNIKERRVKMISVPTTVDTKVAVTFDYRMPGHENEWKLGAHDCLWLSYYKPNQLCSYLVKDLADKPLRHPQIVEGWLVYNNNPPSYSSFTGKDYNWERLQITDHTIEGNNTVINFVLHNYKSGLWGDTHWDGYGYTANHDRANKFYADYVAEVSKLFEAWNPLPAKWSEGVAEWGRKISPFIPKDTTARLVIKSWEGKADPAKDANELWLDQALEVRYLFSFKTGGHESELSSDTISTPWIYAEQRKNPLIEGFPVEGDFLDYVDFIRVYRQCRIAANKVTPPRPIKLLRRNEDTKKFPNNFQDEKSTSNEKQELSTLNNNAVAGDMAAIGLFATTVRELNQSRDEVDTDFSAQPK